MLIERSGVSGEHIPWRWVEKIGLYSSRKWRMKRMSGWPDPTQKRLTEFKELLSGQEL